MIGAGVSPKLVQQRLGHADVSVTLGLYSHAGTRSRRRRGIGEGRRIVPASFCDQTVITGADSGA